MKAIILAAGRGERLMPLTLDRPKPLVDLGGGRTLLDEQVYALRASGVVEESVFVIGYRAEMVERHVGGWVFDRPRLRTIFNPFYGVSNNLMSLWLARGEMNGDFLVTNGDNLFDAAVFTDMTARTGPGIHLALSPKRRFDHDDMKASVRNGVVTAVGKRLDARHCRAESPGLVLVRGARARGAFLRALDELARQPEYLNRFWLEVFNALARRRYPVRPWYFDGRTRWQEIDFHTDMAAARVLLSSKVARLRRPKWPAAA
jgi:choline kinase